MSQRPRGRPPNIPKEPDPPIEPILRREDSQSVLTERVNRIRLKSVSLPTRQIKIEGFIFQEDNDVFCLQDTIFVRAYEEGSKTSGISAQDKRVQEKIVDIETELASTNKTYHRFSVVTDFINPKFHTNINRIGGLDKGFKSKKFLTAKQQEQVKKHNKKRKNYTEVGRIVMEEGKSKKSKSSPEDEDEMSDPDAPAARPSRH